MTFTPRSHVAATKPAKSVVAPPPKEMIMSLRVNPALPSAIQQNSRTVADFAVSASGTSIDIDSISEKLCRNLPATVCIDCG